MKRYCLIVIYQVWRQGKNHIQSEELTMNTFCGKNMGFDYGIETVSGAEGDTEKYYTKEEILNVPNLCWTCKNQFIKTQ